jgi:RNA polymerase sigma factor (sigma-70 family)
MGAHPIIHLQHTNVQALDSEIWNRFKSGDKKALSQIYTRYFDKLYNYGSRITNDSGLTEDCIQDLFVEFWNKREGISDVKNIKFYLYKSLRRKIIYKLSILDKQKLSDDLNHFEIQLSDKSHYLNQEITKDIRLKLTQLVANLLPKQKEAIFLIYYDELSYEEVATIMGLKIKTVYNLVHLAISKLREQKSTLTSFGLFSFI